MAKKQEKEIRTIPVSQSTKEFLASKKTGGQYIFSFFPVDGWDCECVPVIQDWQVKFASMNENERRATILRLDHLECPKDKTGLKLFTITCDNCGATIAKCWAKDATLAEFCDLHYISEHNGETWRGCMTINISPLDKKLGFECTCGADTRDFRTRKSNLHGEALNRKIVETQKGRDFGLNDSKFKAVIAHG